MEEVSPRGVPITHLQNGIQMSYPTATRRRILRDWFRTSAPAPRPTSVYDACLVSSIGADYREARDHLETELASHYYPALSTLSTDLHLVGR